MNSPAEICEKLRKIDAKSAVHTFDTPPFGICGQAADLIEQQERRIAELKAALHELHAQVKGECPRLLNEDSGGDAMLAIEIGLLLADKEPAKGQMPSSSASTRGSIAGADSRDADTLESATDVKTLRAASAPSAVTSPEQPSEGVDEPTVLYAAVRDGVDEWHIECRLSDDQKGAFITVDYSLPILAHRIAAMLSATGAKG